MPTLLLYEMGYDSWKTYTDILKINFSIWLKFYDDTTKHRSKIIADKVAIMAQMFQIMPEGDSKMNMYHVTACRTICANGH
jgi:hypothetical protein